MEEDKRFVSGATFKRISESRAAGGVRVKQFLVTIDVKAKTRRVVVHRRCRGRGLAIIGLDTESEILCIDCESGESRQPTSPRISVCDNFYNVAYHLELV